MEGRKEGRRLGLEIKCASSVKLLEEIKLLLERNPNRERLFRRTVFERWLDIPSHDNDNHLMHYVLQHQVWHLVSLVEDFDKWDDYPWGEYMWETFYKRIVNVVAIHREHHLKQKKKKPDYNPTYNLYGFVWAFKDSNPILELYATPSETKESWFVASINFTNGLVNEDMNVSQDEGVGVVSLLLKGGDGVLDSDRGVKNPNTDKDKQATMAEIFAEILALRKEVALVKGDDERIAKLERLVNQIVINQGKGVAGDGMPIDNVDGNHDIGIGLHNAVNQGLGGSSNDLMSLCSLADIDKGEVV
ncbi:hypothetical protein Tco_0272115, partial [Tanacetum coccineum]